MDSTIWIGVITAAVACPMVLHLFWSDIRGRNDDETGE